MSSTAPGDRHPADPAELRAGIERTRAELGHTVQELVAKADVPARVRHKADSLRHRAARRRDEAGGALHDHTPPPLRGAVTHAAEFGRRHPKGVAAAGAAVGIAVVAATRAGHHSHN
ncbi:MULTISPECIES: DUF3618 domain-containing protein [Streptomycetaceae]|uniref:DUF3618 domain-containing protein n=1 Tax=Streptantibioticus cattleyicolor (strain ATCC 35852 / DSM 46488 / JCM 4925 / NBRC 14057 / NRRL 8057) TaxID=1003195 RepID=F8JRJ9_STREN|nr:MULTISPECIES: DUF3618 domain-containing protein [Streptomycetaceae]AEW97885.1 hypothetical protein SCATT_55140 [Streptantibioticus cattleyicolor NRRL 8057 = DSM 46488]MYS62294.1 DUF3618 domain-containing protein [Streptomyces sp. SID5468]CCB78200.1 protein of unknown function [Streptantibioticus cattleyicolor NRRL 8057 = DSM 46488]